jgi:hypothetical protein
MILSSTNRNRAKWCIAAIKKPFLAENVILLSSSSSLLYKNGNDRFTAPKWNTLYFLLHEPLNFFQISLVVWTGTATTTTTAGRVGVFIHSAFFGACGDEWSNDTVSRRRHNRLTMLNQQHHLQNTQHHLQQ